MSVLSSDAPIMIFHGRFDADFFCSSKLSDSDFFPLSNQQERMKDFNTNKVVIWYGMVYGGL